MTLIAAFKCSDGFVLCSDSQETAGPNLEYRVSRQKMIPEQCGNFEIAAAGSGNNGDLLDAFVIRLHENLKNSSVGSLSDLKNFIHNELSDFLQNESAGYSSEEKDMSFIIGARSLDPPACITWKTAASRLKEVTTFAITGFEDERYEYLLKNLYRPNMPLAQGIFLGLHVMALAEQTSNYVKAPVTVVIVKTNSIRQEKQQTIDQLEQRVRLFGSQVDNIMLACPDTGLQPAEFSSKLKEFVATIIQFRKEYIEELLGQQLAQGLQINEDYNLMPAGTTIITATQAQAAALQRTNEELVKTLREQEDGKQGYDRILANLRATKVYREWYRDNIGQNNDDLWKPNLTGHGELLQAALMGPYKISQIACNALNRVIEFFNLDLGFGVHEKIRTDLLAIDQCIEIIEREIKLSPSPPAPPAINSFQE